MQLKRSHYTGIIIAAAIILSALIMLETRAFFFMIGIGVLVGISPFVLSAANEAKLNSEKEEMFLEFTRNLAESVKAGTPVSKSIINLKEKYYGSLTPHVKKLGNQISLGIPVKNALDTFAKDVDSSVVTRAVSLISEAEKAGGEIEGILNSVASSVSEIEKLKKERQSAIYSLVVQGYIIFFVFIVIMLIMQFKILPMTSEITTIDPGFGFSGFTSKVSSKDVAAPLVYLLIVQGLFTGLIIGKLAEGNLKAGIKHSFAMVALSLLIYTGAKLWF